MSLLDDARKRINAIDEEMAGLFEQRMQAVEDVIRYKQAHQMQVWIHPENSMLSNIIQRLFSGRNTETAILNLSVQ